MSRRSNTHEVGDEGFRKRIPSPVSIRGGTVGRGVESCIAGVKQEAAVVVRRHGLR